VHSETGSTAAFVSTAPHTHDRDHPVLVYRHEAQLIEVAGGFLCEAIVGGGSAIALASEAHLQALEGWVRICADGLEPAAAEGRFHALAIERLVRELETAADPAATFEASLLSVLERVPDGSGPVHVFGEVAATLWGQRRVDAALSLEEVRNALRETRQVSFLCAYPEDVLAVGDDAERARQEHTMVLRAPPFPLAPPQAPAEVVSAAVLPPAPAACRAARRLVRSACTSEAGADAIDMAELLVSELAGNAVRHARSTFTAEVSFPNGAVRLAVTDAKPLPHDWKGFPVDRGHGLGLVAAVSENWAIEPLAGGKLVWAELPRDLELARD
jgi:hypothetical protein